MIEEPGQEIKYYSSQICKRKDQRHRSPAKKGYS